MYKKNDVIQLEISTLGSEGEAIGKIDGFPFFVRGAVPGDVIEAGVTKVKKNMAFARLIRIITPSGDRVEPACPYFGKCGGCQLMNMSYAAQLGYKEEKVKNDLIRIGGIDKDIVEKASRLVLSAAETLHYRNKEQYPFGTDKEGNIICGFYAYHSHRIIDQTDCLLGNEENGLILTKIKEWMKECGLTSYDETSGRGYLRHVMIRKGNLTDEIMVCLVINARKFKGSEILVEKLKDIPGVTSISFSSNTEDTNVIMGDNSTLLWGQERIKTFIESDNGNIEYALSPLSFYQVNPEQTRRLYSKTLEYADLKGNETVWDLYCGIGTISLFLAEKAKRVFGVEIVSQAIEDAKHNAELNGICNAEFICGAAEEVLPAYYKNTSEKPDVVVVDPPRKGCDKSCLDTIIKASPIRIVYVSCDPATLARDIKYLRENGYELQAYTPCDMFPNSYHVETIALLSKLSEAKHHIEVKVDMDELDLTSAEAKATYKEIQDWVQEKYGFHVTNLNIAQVKQKHGIIERENYNKAKSADSKQPGCPSESPISEADLNATNDMPPTKGRGRYICEEKVKAIEDAMRHFQMID